MTAVNDKVNELGKLAKNSGPVQNADQKFRELKQKIAAENPDNKIVKAVQQVSDWAKENPGKATLAVGILTATASILTGPGGGAAAGFLRSKTKGTYFSKKTHGRKYHIFYFTDNPWYF